MTGATQAPEWAAAAFVPSLVFGHFRQRYGSIVPGAALHLFVLQRRIFPARCAAAAGRVR
jgi:hypothetical protein